MENLNLSCSGRAHRLAEMYPSEMFSRMDENDDSKFYATDRMVSHLDSCALNTVQRIIGSLVNEQSPKILDLMASWDSHLPPDLRPAQVTGLGMNENELRANHALDQYLVHDLNTQPMLPFPEAEFDAVINVVSVDYLTDPLKVFNEAARVLKPGGLHLVIFSNRWFEPKVTGIWRNSSENERVCLVQDWFSAGGKFEPFDTFVSKGLPRPADDKYAGKMMFSDPVYAVWAQRKGGDANREPRPYPSAIPKGNSEPGLLEKLTAEAPQTLACPHCGERMKKWEVPQTPFTEWTNEYMHVCFNDECPYLLRGFEAMSRQGNVGSSYRLMYNPETGAVGPILVQSLTMLKDGIIE